MWLLAVSDTAITGAAGVLGALVGATAGALADYALEVKRERRQALVGARVLRAEMLRTATCLKSAEAEGLWWDFYEVSLPAWDRYEPALASRLRQGEYQPVIDAVIGYADFSDTVRRSIKEGERATLLPASVQAKNRTLRERLTIAYNGLARLAKEPEADEVLRGEITSEQQEKADARRAEMEKFLGTGGQPEQPSESGTEP